ncbi:MAG: response regulator [Candidatus Brocadiales bacterium]|nr:response regulator [Candidatus Brocadiales bacterium]
MGKPKLLIIDDDKNLCEDLMDTLELEGYLTEAAYTAGGGIKKTKEDFYNIILLDMRIPDSNGMEALDNIKEISPDTEVIIFTAFAETQDVIEAMDRNAFSYILKPFEMPHLLSVLGKATEKQKLLFENRKLFQHVSDGKKDWEETFDSIPDLIVILDVDLNIIKCNKAVFNQLNVKPEDLIGTKCYDVLPARNEPCSICLKERSQKSLKAEKLETEYMGRFLLISCFPRFDESGKMNGIVQVISDITERKHIEEKLRMSTKIASIGRLTSSVFHEVLNPVNIISSHVQLLLAEAEKDSKTEEDLMSIQEEIDRIVKITDGLMRYSTEGELITKEVETNSILESVLSVLEPEMKLCSIKCIKNFDEGLPEIIANADGLRQVFLNLMTNSIDALPDGGTLTVKSKSVQRSGLGVRGKKEKDYPPRRAGELKGDFVEITFEDTGCGISSENIDKIFEPFFSTKKKVTEVGLGLSESYGIIQSYGGTICVESEEGSGSTFKIVFPAIND